MIEVKRVLGIQMKGGKMLLAQGLKKRYGDIIALDGVSIQIERGRTVGLLGPNGAGKTTAVSIICGVLQPDEGQVVLDGQPIRSETDPAKRRIGLVPQELALFDDLSAQENLRIFGSLYDLDYAALRSASASALDLVGLADRAHHRVKTFSGGMKRRLNLAAALLHDPDLLILDEPTVGVDPQSRNAIFENLETLKSRGKTLLYTTHYMEEAERLCDRIIIVDHGRVVADDHLRGLYQRLPAANRIIIDLSNSANGSPSWLREIRGIPGVVEAQCHDEQLSVDVTELAHTMPKVLGWLADRGLEYAHAQTERPSLESVFLHLTGRSLRDS